MAPKKKVLASKGKKSEKAGTTSKKPTSSKKEKKGAVSKKTTKEKNDLPLKKTTKEKKETKKTITKEKAVTTKEKAATTKEKASKKVVAKKEVKSTKKTTKSGHKSKGSSAKAGAAAPPPPKKVLPESDTSSVDDYEDDDYEEDFEDVGEYEDDFEDLDAGGSDGSDFDGDSDNDDADEDDNSMAHKMKEMNKYAGLDPEMKAAMMALDEENAAVQRRLKESKKNAKERVHQKEKLELSLLPERKVIDLQVSKEEQHRINRAKRGKELIKLITLEGVSFELLDIPPLTEYELYIRSFGASNTVQASTQCRDTDLEKSIQTEDVRRLNKAVQYPDHAGSYSEFLQSDIESNNEIDVDLEERMDLMMRELQRSSTSGILKKFLFRAGSVLSALLDENVEELDACSSSLLSSNHNPNSTANAIIPGGGSGSDSGSWSQSHFPLPLPAVLQDRPAQFLGTCANLPHFMLVIFGRARSFPKNFEAFSEKNIIGIWNLNNPRAPNFILFAEGSLSCACFSDTNPELIVAGTQEGGVLLWDLRENETFHQIIGDVVLRRPTYYTFGEMGENHSVPITAVTPLHEDNATAKKSKKKPADADGEINNIGDVDGEGDDTNIYDEDEINETDISTQDNKIRLKIATVDSQGLVLIWVAIEMTSSTISDTDFGLSPGGRVKLMKTGSIQTPAPHYALIQPTPTNMLALKASDLAFHPTDANQFFVATDVGKVIHGVRFGSAAIPSEYFSRQWGTQQLGSDLTDGSLSVSSIHFSPFISKFFLAAVGHSVCLYDVHLSYPVAIFDGFTKGTITRVFWSIDTPTVFFVLDSNSMIFLINFAHDLLPLFADDLQSFGRNPNSHISSFVPVKHLGKLALAVVIGADIAIHVLNQSYVPRNIQEGLKQFDTFVKLSNL